MRRQSMRALADELVSGLKQQLPACLGDDGKGLWSVCVCGSYVRGDFMERNSDLDFHLVFEPGSDASSDPDGSDGFLAVRKLVDGLLAGRKFVCHNPNQFDWTTSSWESLPKRQADIHIPDGSPMNPLLNMFLFDYIENLLALWGTDPRSLMPKPLPFVVLAKSWFGSVQIARDRYLGAGNEWRVPFSAFKSIQVAQALFGERTLDKRYLSDLYKRYVPDFPLKEFGCRIIRDKVEQTFPDHPCEFAPWQDYAAFEDQLSELTLAGMQMPVKDSEQADSGSRDGGHHEVRGGCGRHRRERGGGRPGQIRGTDGAQSERGPASGSQ